MKEGSERGKGEGGRKEREPGGERSNMEDEGKGRRWWGEGEREKAER